MSKNNIKQAKYITRDLCSAGQAQITRNVQN